MPLIASHLGATPEWLTALSAAGAAAGILQLGATPLVERIGYRRTLLAAWSMVMLPAAGIAALLWSIGARGHGGWWVGVFALLVLLNGLARTVAGIAWYPWLRASLPAERLGRFLGLDMLVTSSASLVALVLVGRYLGKAPDTGSFLTLLAVGLGANVLAVMLFRSIPRPVAVVSEGGERRPTLRELPAAGMQLFRGDRFREAAIYIALYQAATAPLGILLFVLQEKLLGVPADRILYLQATGQACLALSAAAWGRHVDRRGARRILLTANLGLLTAIAGWLLVGARPGGTPMALLLLLAAAVGAFQGGHSIAHMRLMLHVCPERNPAIGTALFQTIGAMLAVATPLASSLLLAGAKGLGATDSQATVLCLLAVATVLVGSLVYLARRPACDSRVAVVLHR